MNASKEAARNWVAAHERQLSDWHQIIWNYAEPAWREYRSAAWYVHTLREHGFSVEEGSGGMPTAFCAEWRNGEGGPTVGAYAEYDATPDHSQQAVPWEAPREGLSRYAAGHVDPHSALGIGALAGVLAAQHAMRQHHIAGRLKFFGEPAEKTCGSKPIHAAKGYYDDVDAFISFHPAYLLPHCNSVNWDVHAGCSYGRVFTFECRHAETWGGPSPLRTLWPAHALAPRAPGALDAACLMYTSSKYLYGAMLPRNSGWYITEYMMTGGQATADNQTARIAQLYYCWRAPTVEMMERVAEVLENNAQHVAAMTHCTCRGEWVQKNRPGLPNHVMARLGYANLRLAGPPQFGEEARAFGRKILENLGYTPPEDPFLPECSQLHDPEEVDAILRESLPPWQKNMLSDDYTEYGWHAPTVRLFIGRCMVERPQDGPQTVLPSWAFDALGGKRECIDPTIFSAGRTIAYIILDLLTKPEVLARAWEEFTERTGGGKGGSRWIPPLLPADHPAPIHFRWPEYATTPRGERQWWLPESPFDRASGT